VAIWLRGQLWLIGQLWNSGQFIAILANKVGYGE